MLWIQPDTCFRMGRLSQCLTLKGRNSLSRTESALLFLQGKMSLRDSVSADNSVDSNSHSGTSQLHFVLLVGMHRGVLQRRLSSETSFKFHFEFF